jgi:hypothetical protein
MTPPANVNKQRMMSMTDLILKRAAAQEPARIPMACRPPNGMLSRELVWVEKPRPLIRVGPKVFPL